MDEYDIREEIGKGGFSSVVKAKKAGKNFAIKILDYGLMTASEKNNMIREINIMRKLTDGCVNVIRYIDRIIDRTHSKLYIVMEYVKTRPIVIKDIGDEIKIRYIFLSLLKTLKCIHDAHIIHNDIKPNNIVYDGTNIRIIDFGGSCEDTDDPRCYYQFGTPLYMSPEKIKAFIDYRDNLIDSKTYTFEEAKNADVWALGCAFFYYMNGYNPQRRAKSLTDILTVDIELSDTGSKWDMVINSMLIRDINRRETSIENIIKIIDR